MSTNNELLDKLKEFLSEEEIQQGIEKGVIKVDVEKSMMPLTGHEAGLDSGTGSIVSSTPGPASWEMVKTSIAKAVDEMEKACKFLSKAEPKEEEDEDEKEVEKAYDNMVNTADRMKQHMKMYKAKKNTNKSLGFEKEDFEKAFNERLSPILKENQDLTVRNQKLEKSIQDLTSLVSQVQNDIKKIGEQTPAPKSVNVQAFIEKGGAKNKEGKKTFHLDYHKNQIVGELEKARMDADDIMKAQIDDDILNLVSANAAPSDTVAQYLYDKRDVAIIR